MAEQKTKPTPASVTAFLDAIADEQVRKDCYALSALMEAATGHPPKMWGASIVGFGQYHYKYDSGHEGDSCLTGFSPRKQNISLYLMHGASDHSDLLNKLGKFKAGKGCIYIKKLSDVDQHILTDLVKECAEKIRN